MQDNSVARTIRLSGQVDETLDLPFLIYLVLFWRDVGWKEKIEPMANLFPKEIVLKNIFHRTIVSCAERASNWLKYYFILVNAAGMLRMPDQPIF